MLRQRSPPSCSWWSPRRCRTTGCCTSTSTRSGRWGGPGTGLRALRGHPGAPILRGVAIASGRLRPYAVAAAWTVYEYLKSSGFLGFPWGLAAYPVNAIAPLIQFTALTGVWGLSLLMALINAAVAEGVQHQWRQQPVRTYFMIALLAIGALGYGFVRLGTEPSRESGAGARTPLEGGADPAQRRSVGRRRRGARGQPTHPDGGSHAACSTGAGLTWSSGARPPWLDQPVGENRGRYRNTDFGRFPNGNPLAPFLRSLDVHLITRRART